MIADVTPRVVRPSLISIVAALAIGVSIAIQMIRGEPERRDAAGQTEIFPSVWQKIVSGPAVIIVLFLAFAIYAAVRYLPVWP